MQYRLGSLFRYSNCWITLAWLISTNHLESFHSLRVSGLSVSNSTKFSLSKIDHLRPTKMNQNSFALPVRFMMVPEYIFIMMPMIFYNNAHSKSLSLGSCPVPSECIAIYFHITLCRKSPTFFHFAERKVSVEKVLGEICIIRVLGK